MVSGEFMCREWLYSRALRSCREQTFPVPQSPHRACHEFFGDSACLGRLRVIGQLTNVLPHLDGSLGKASPSFRRSLRRRP